MSTNNALPATIGELRDSGYQSVSVREEMRRNLIAKIRAEESVFPGIIGFDQTVIPQLENAILAGQDIILLGERGQAKTRLIREMVNLLDEQLPGTSPAASLNDDPYNPLSPDARQMVEDMGDNTPVAWIGRDMRYSEKLATPDISIADLIGEIDPIKVAEGQAPVRRIGHPLRPGAANQPGHFLHQRAARPGRADPGGSVQPDGRAGRADQGLSHPDAAGRFRGGHGQPRGLHQPRSHRHPAEGPLRRADPHPLPTHPGRRDRHHGPGAQPLPRRGSGGGARVHDGDRGGGDGSGGPATRSTSVPASACAYPSPTTRR